jgi:hypothetical protein
MLTCHGGTVNTNSRNIHGTAKMRNMRDIEHRRFNHKRAPQWASRQPYFPKVILTDADTRPKGSDFACPVTVHSFTVSSWLIRAHNRGSARFTAAHTASHARPQRRRAMSASDRITDA